MGVYYQSLHKNGNSNNDVAITIMLMAINTPISCKLKLLSNPSIALLLMRISTSITGIITGKLSIAISVPLLLAFDAIADIMVNTVEKLMPPNNTAKK